MDFFKVIFIFVIINILDCFADLSWQERLKLLMQYRRANARSKVPTSYNPYIFNVRDDKAYQNRRSFVSEEAPEPDSRKHFLELNPKKYYKVNRRSFVNEEAPELEVYDSQKNFLDLDPKKYYKVNRRLYDAHAGMKSPIIASPTMPNQLPEAEPILPGHTLLRPSLGMLKSAVKFPHKDLDDGAGVYGNIENLGITYGGTNERLLYTGFRRNNYDLNAGNDKPRLLVAFLRQGPEYEEEELEKPVLRYIDYGKRERERKKRNEAEKLRKQQQMLGLTAPKESYFNSYNQDNVRDVKRLLKTLTANGVTLEFFDIPRLKLEAMEQKENYHESVKPYTEFIEAIRSKDLSTVKQRFPAIAKQYAREISPNYYKSAVDNSLVAGVKSYG